MQAGEMQLRADGVEAGLDYVYAVGAQDCTPSESVLLGSVTVRPN